MTANVGPGRYGPIEIFRAGTFSPMGVGSATISEKDLRDIVANYDKSLHPAPVVIGHPDADTPAFGWVDGLFVQDGIMKATLEETAPAFADLVKTGRYKRISVSLFTPKAPNNPKPGQFYLKHVGFLGAAAPAVPGLKPVKFIGQPEETINLVQDNAAPLSFSVDDELAQLRRQVREQEVEKLIGQGRVLPVFKDEVLAFAASLDDTETVSFSEGVSGTRKDWFLSYLARSPKVVSFGAMDLEADTVGRSTGPGGGRDTHKVPDGYSVDRRNEGVLHAARELARLKGINFADAVDLVLAEGVT